MKRLPVDLEELIIARDNGDPCMELRYYLDTQTGEVLLVTDVSMRAAEELASQREDEELRAELLDDEEEAALAILEGEQGRYVYVWPRESREKYAVMVEFARSQADRLRSELEHALEGRGAFRRFKDVLLDYPAQRQQWFAFEAQEARQDALSWLREHDLEGVELVPDPPGPPEVMEILHNVMERTAAGTQISENRHQVGRETEKIRPRRGNQSV